VTPDVWEEDKLEMKVLAWKQCASLATLFIIVMVLGKDTTGYDFMPSFLF